ncbi:MAG: cysteine desulfurase [Bacteriovoracaceae bacterium]|nr:cysteine desulfurase [Bacteriovoracaceae bacterium]
MDNIRSHFPQLEDTTHGNKIIYFDNAATTLKPKSVADSLITYYQKETSNIHRGIHTLSEVSTNKYEYTRELLKDFIGANSTKEVIFTKGTTESINILAHSFSSAFIGPGDEIIITELEHHSNIVPWQLLKDRCDITIKVLPINDKGELQVEKLKELLSDKTKLISFNYISNALGIINPVKEIVKIVKENSNAFIHVDAAQASGHTKIDVKDLDCDFLSLSAHKMFGPTGCGLLYGKQEHLEKMPPFLGGGDMIDTVTFEKTTFNDLPYKFEAGTPHIGGIIAWAKAIEFINSLNFDEIQRHEDDLLKYATAKLSSIDGLTIHGTSEKKTSVISFTMEGLHAHDIATFLNKYNIAVRSGHHCTSPLMKRLGVPATARASFSIYNTKQEVDALYEALVKIKEMFC